MFICGVSFYKRCDIRIHWSKKKRSYWSTKKQPHWLQARSSSKVQTSYIPSSDLPTVPGFPGLSRKLSFCPGVPETYRMSRDRLPTCFVSRHPFRYMISILETLQRWASEGSHKRYCAICRIFNYLTFELQ